MTAFHTNPSLMRFAAVEVEENKIISEWHEVLRGWERQGKINSQRKREREAERNRQRERFNSSPPLIRRVCMYVCVYVEGGGSVPPEGPVFVCTLMILTARLYQQKQGL